MNIYEEVKTYEEKEIFGYIDLLYSLEIYCNKQVSFKDLLEMTKEDFHSNWDFWWFVATIQRSKAMFDLAHKYLPDIKDPETDLSKLYRTEESIELLKKLKAKKNGTNKTFIELLLERNIFTMTMGDKT